MSASTTTNNVYIDMSTFSELEGFLYGGQYAITWFVASVTKSNWFSFIPVSLRHTGLVDFGQRQCSAKVNRSGDYSLGAWFRAYVPCLGFATTPGADLASIRYVKNFMHNLFERVQVMFNELVIQEFTNYWLDINAAFRVTASKKDGYDAMIGNGVLDIGANSTVADAAHTASGYFQLPLPVFWGEDSGVALPLAALPFNEVTIQYHLRRWQELVVLGDQVTAQAAGFDISAVKMLDPVTLAIIGEPSLGQPETWSHYVVVHNDERIKMGDAPRDILIHQVQELSPQPFKDVNTSSRFDIRLSHAATAIFYMAENTSWFDRVKGKYGRVMSNYTTAPSDKAQEDAYDPIMNSVLLYESTVRFNMGSDYASLTVPWYFGDVIPVDTGFHMWSYALKPFMANGACGSTNLSKLANVSIEHTMSPIAASAAQGLDSKGVLVASGSANPWGQFPQVDMYGTAGAFLQTFRHNLAIRNHNVIRVANGGVSQPSL